MRKKKTAKTCFRAISVESHDVNKRIIPCDHVRRMKNKYKLKMATINVKETFLKQPVSQ